MLWWNGILESLTELSKFQMIGLHWTTTISISIRLYMTIYSDVEWSKLPTGFWKCNTDAGLFMDSGKNRFWLMFERWIRSICLGQNILDEYVLYCTVGGQYQWCSWWAFQNVELSLIKYKSFFIITVDLKFLLLEDKQIWQHTFLLIKNFVTGPTVFWFTLISHNVFSILLWKWFDFAAVEKTLTNVKTDIFRWFNPILFQIFWILTGWSSSLNKMIRWEF